MIEYISKKNLNKKIELNYNV